MCTSGEIHRKTLRRTQVSAFFARAPRGVVAMEACGSAHHWGRLLSSFGHEVKLIAAQFVRPFVKTNKTDAADAQAIWEAAQRPDMRFVSVKSEQQQAVLSLHRLRAQWVSIRTQQANQIRGLLYEFGIVVPLGWRSLLKAVPQLTDEVPTLLRTELLEQLEALRTATSPYRCPREATRELARQLNPTANASWPSPASARSPRPRWLPASPMPASSVRHVSSPPISAWSRVSRGPADESSCWGSANGVIPTYGRCWSMARVRCC